MIAKEKITSTQVAKIAPRSVGFLNPQVIVNKLKISSGMKIAHFGCGAGYFTFPLAKRVGKEGIVYALDILKQKIDNLKSQANLWGLKNITTIKTNLEIGKSSQLKEESIDWVIIVNVLYQNDKKGSILKEAKRILKPKGKILLIDWGKENKFIGPAEQVRISKGELIKKIRKYSLGIQKEIAVGDFHFGMVLTK